MELTRALHQLAPDALIVGEEASFSDPSALKPGSPLPSTPSPSTPLTAQPTSCAAASTTP